MTDWRKLRLRRMVLCMRRIGSGWRVRVIWRMSDLPGSSSDVIVSLRNEVERRRIESVLLVLVKRVV